MMSQISRHVLERFPRYADLIRRLADENDEFASLCDDYALVVDTLHWIAAQTGAGRDELVADYRAYLLELELEIADALTAGST